MNLKSSVQARSAAAGRFAVLIIFVQVLGLRAGWSQEAAQPDLNHEFTKQEEIYRSRGADVPDGYVTTRGLADYAGYLHASFCDTLSRLGPTDRWLDIGAGAGQAVLDYYAPKEVRESTETCARSRGLARAVAMSIEDRRTDAWHKLAAGLGERIRYVSGKPLRQYSLAELGKFQIITDVYGGFSYTEDLSPFMEKVLNLLEVGGSFHTILQYTYLEAVKEIDTAGYQTELVDAAGRSAKVCSWLKRTSCVQVTCESKSTWKPPTEQITIRKTCSDVVVPRMKLLKFTAGNPPNRRFQLEP